MLISASNGSALSLKATKNVMFISYSVFIIIVMMMTLLISNNKNIRSDYLKTKQYSTPMEMTVLNIIDNLYLLVQWFCIQKHRVI